MLVSAIVHIVRFCIRHPKAIIAAYALLGIASAYYAATHFAINTDVNKLLSPTLDWRQRELDFEKSFPGRYDSILVVVDAPTPELASSATRALAQRLKANKTEFRSVEELASGAFFARQGLLFQPVEELSKTTQALAQASRGRHRPVLSVGRDGITLGVRVKGCSIYEVATTGTPKAIL